MKNAVLFILLFMSMFLSTDISGQRYIKNLIAVDSASLSGRGIPSDPLRLKGLGSLSFDTFQIKGTGVDSDPIRLAIDHRNPEYYLYDNYTYNVIMDTTWGNGYNYGLYPAGELTFPYYIPGNGTAVWHLDLKGNAISYDSINYIYHEFSAPGTPGYFILGNRFEWEQNANFIVKQMGTTRYINFSTGNTVFRMDAAADKVTLTGGDSASGGLIFTISKIPTYADNTAAVSGGLAQGAIYKTPTGQLMIRL